MQPAWSTALRSVHSQEEVPHRALATFNAGDHVRHVKFGEGIVVTAMPTANGADQEVTVAFKGEFGVKKLLLSFAPLEKLDA
jgi:hypothetical protein